MTVSELLVETLARAGVKRILAVVGDSLDGIADAVRRRDNIQWITVRHEEVAAFAAGAEAHLTGTLAVCAGCAGAHTELVALAERLQAPIVHALRGKEFIEYDNPYDVGMNGLLGIRSGYLAMENCEALLMLGTDFPYQQFYPTEAWVCQVDLRPEQLGRRARLDLGLVGNVKDTLQALLPRLEQNADSGHLKDCQEHFRSTREGLDELATPAPADKPIHPQYLARCLDELAADDAVFTVDVGTSSIWACRYLKMNGRRRIVGSWSHGSMAGALPQAIDAQLEFPNRQVVTMSGDGGFAMLMGDLLSVAQHKLPIKIVIFNNSALGFVDLEMKAAGILGDGTDLVNPDFARLAEAVGIKGLRVDKSDDLKEALRTAFEHPGPALIDVVVNRQELSMPPTVSMEQAVGFNLYALKAVFNGRGDKILDLAKTNLRQVMTTLLPGVGSTAE